MTLQDILKDDYSKLTQFSEEEKSWIEKRIKIRKDGKPGVECILRGKTAGDNHNDYFELKPEEIVRQIYAKKLINDYEYSPKRIEFEKIVQMGRDESKRADIVVYEDDAKTSPYIVVECKAAGKDKVKGQLESYCKTLGASIAIEVDGGETKEFYYNRQNSQNKNYKLEKIDRIPKANQTLSEILNDRFTIKDLIIADSKNTKTLKDIVLDLEDKVLANSGVDEFEEVFKFIFAKLYDEYLCADENEKIATLMNEGYLKDIEAFNDEDFTQMQFRSVGSENQVAKKIQHLFDEAQNKWNGIFPANTKFLLNPADIKNIVSYLENVKLFNSNLDVVDDTFEHLVNQTKKGEKGQYFTPRYVIDMCAKMLNPTETESMIDTASGSCGFPMHTIFHVWHKMNPKRNNFVNAKRSRKETDYVEQKIFAIDFDPKSVRVGRLLNIIAGDGKSNVLELNTLDYNTWNTRIQDENWRKVNISGFDKMIAFAKDEKSYKEFNFDIVMANPPFAGDRNDTKVISLYELGRKGEKSVDNIGRDILFIERNLNFLKPGGRMAVVLPQGRFNNLLLCQ